MRRKKIGKKRIAKKKVVRRRAPTRIAVPYQFGPIGKLKTHYFDSVTGKELGPRPPVGYKKVG
jgi:hypothetical protein